MAVPYKIKFLTDILDASSNNVISKNKIYNIIFHILKGLYPEEVLLIPHGSTEVTRKLLTSVNSTKGKVAAEITYIPSSVTTIGENAFRGCSSLTSVTIPDSVTSIGGWAFYECDALTSVTIGNSVTSIGDWAFYHCEALTSVTIPDSVTSIGDHAFRECSSLTSVTIGDSVTSIGAEAFYDCDGLTNVTIGDSVTTISNFAFDGCENLTSVTIPNSVTNIDYEAFGTQLTNITYTGTMSYWDGSMTRENGWCGAGRSAANKNLPIVTCTDGIIDSDGIHKIQLNVDQTYSIILPEASDKIHLQGKIKVAGNDYTFNNENIKLPEAMSSFKLKLSAESSYEEDNKYRIYIKPIINGTAVTDIPLDSSPSWSLMPFIKEPEFYIIGASFANKAD